TRLAVREATRLAGADVPLHLVATLTAVALALKYALDTRLAVREATRLAGADVPLHLVATLTAVALALKY
ncbi:hypothetical protein CKJ89_39435, partial [Klebsiella pneumoniae]